MYHRPYFGLTNNPPFSYHELASLSTGPVFIPKVYNGKNKTFFLFGWSMHRERYNSSVFTTVPTPAELNGDFTFGGIGYPIYDPASTKPVNALWSSTPFPGNIIPKNRFDPAVVKFLSNTPWDTPNQANVPLTAAGPVANNYAGTSTYYSYRYRYDAKVDHNFSDKNRIFGRYSQVINRAVGDQIGINWRFWTAAPSSSRFDQEQAVISDTEVFSPTFLNEVRSIVSVTAGGSLESAGSRVPPTCRIGEFSQLQYAGQIKSLLRNLPGYLSSTTSGADRPLGRQGNRISCTNPLLSRR